MTISTRNRAYPECPEITPVPGCRGVGVVWWYCWSSRQALSSFRKERIPKIGSQIPKLHITVRHPNHHSEQMVLFFFWWVMDAKGSSGSFQHSWGWAKDQLWAQISWPQLPHHSMLPHLHASQGCWLYCALWHAALTAGLSQSDAQGACMLVCLTAFLAMEKVHHSTDIRWRAWSCITLLNHVYCDNAGSPLLFEVKYKLLLIDVDNNTGWDTSIMLHNNHLFW